MLDQKLWFGILDFWTIFELIHNSDFEVQPVRFKTVQSWLNLSLVQHYLFYPIVEAKNLLDMKTAVQEKLLKQNVFFLVLQI